MKKQPYLEPNEALNQNDHHQHHSPSISIRETLENLKVGPHRILTPLSQQGFSKGRDWGGGGFPVFP